MNTEEKKNKKLRKLKTKRRRIITVSVITVIYLAVIAAVALIYRHELAGYVSDPQAFRDWIGSFGFVGQLVYVAIATVQVVLGVIHDGPLQIAGGYAFGTLRGTLLFIIGFVLGSLIAFLLARRFGRMIISLFFSEEKYEKLFDDIKNKNLYTLVFLLYLVPGTPKDMLTYCFGTTKIKLPYFLILSAVGRIPSVLLTVMIAQNIVNPSIIMILTIISAAALLIVLGRIVHAYMRKRKK